MLYNLPMPDPAFVTVSALLEVFHKVDAMARAAERGAELLGPGDRDDDERQRLKNWAASADFARTQINAAIPHAFQAIRAVFDDNGEDIEHILGGAQDYDQAINLIHNGRQYIAIPEYDVTSWTGFIQVAGQRDDA